MSSSSQTRRWIAAGFVGALLVALFSLAGFGTGERGTSIGLQLTGRFSFLLFFIGYVYRPVRHLLNESPHRWSSLPRLAGVAFASAMSVHLSLVAWLCWIGATPPLGTFVLFGGAVISTYLLALKSHFKLETALGRRGNRMLQTFSVHYVAIVFAADFLRVAPSPTHKYIIGYLPFALVGAAAPSLRFWCFMRHRVHGAAVHDRRPRLRTRTGISWSRTGTARN